MPTFPVETSPGVSALPVLSVEEALDEPTLLHSGASLEEVSAIRQCAAWTTTFPLQRVRKRRRVEAICPMLAPSLMARGLVFSSLSMGEREPDLDRLDEVLREAADVFDRKIDCVDSRLKCLVLILPGVRGARLLEATTPERSIKNELLRRGILVGEFFPTCPFATTFNPRLFALRSPAPMYVLRTFLESDWRFICQIPSWQKTYRERFGEPPEKLRHLGGPLWRLKQKLVWRIDALKRRFLLRKEETGLPGS